MEPQNGRMDPGATGVLNPSVDPVMAAANPLMEIGLPGLKQARGYPYEEWLPELSGERGRRVYREMMDSDPIITAMMFAIEMLARQINWSVNPASAQNEDLRAAQFLREVLFEDQNMSWDEELSEIMSFPGWGWCWMEHNWKQRKGANPGSYTDEYGEHQFPKSKFSDGRIGLKNLAPRGQETLLHWVFDESGSPKAMVQMPPPDFRIRTIPLQKSLLFRTVNRKQNPEGRSVLRGAYEPWRTKRNIQLLEAIGVERDLAGIPVAKIPPEYMDPNAPDTYKLIYAQVQEIVRNIRNDSQTGIVMPMAYDDAGHLLWDLSLLSTAGSRQFQTNEIIDRYDQRITTVILADFIMIGSKGAGSLALARTKTNIFSVAMGTFLDHVAEVMNTHFVPRLFQMNGWRIDRLPTISHSRLAAFPLEDLAAYITALAQAGMPMFPSPDGELERHLLQAGDLPVPQTSFDELEDQNQDGQEGDIEDEAAEAYREGPLNRRLWLRRRAA